MLGFTPSGAVLPLLPYFSIFLSLDKKNGDIRLLLLPPPTLIFCFLAFYKKSGAILPCLKLQLSNIL